MNRSEVADLLRSLALLIEQEDRVWAQLTIEPIGENICEVRGAYHRVDDRIRGIKELWDETRLSG